MRFDHIWFNARLATLAGDGLGIVEGGAIAAKDGRIAFAGSSKDLPTGWDAAERSDCEGRWITPGLVGCHTYLIFGGDRAHEFELRLKGASYEEIARAGGGILSTVKATRAASEDELVSSALGRLDTIGTLEPGKSCDLAIWNIECPAELVYRIGFNPLHARIWRGL